jgi:hypothetical protein
MNTVLRTEIIKHIYSNFGIIPSDYLINTKSLINDNFLIKEKISFENEDNKIVQNNIWGCEFSVESQNIKVLLADSSQEKDLYEYYLLIHLKDAPMYCMYLNFNNESKLNLSIDSESWMECSTFLQATFLAGMEQLKESIISLSKINDYMLQYNCLINFIKLHISEEEYER